VAAYYVNNCYFIHPYVSQMNTMDYRSRRRYPAQLKPFTDKGVPKANWTWIGNREFHGGQGFECGKAIAEYAIKMGMAASWNGPSALQPSTPRY